MSSATAYSGSLPNLRAYSFLFGFDKRGLSDGPSHYLIEKPGMSKAVMTSTHELKPLYLAHDVATTFSSGAHVDASCDSELAKICRRLKVRLQVAEGGVSGPLSYLRAAGVDAENFDVDEEEIAARRLQGLQSEFAMTSAAWMTGQGIRDVN